MTMSSQRTTRPFSPVRAASIAALVALGAVLLPAAASAAAPAWKLTVASNPTHFVPGSKTPGFPQYFLLAANIGSAPTSGAATIVDTLPDGVVPVKAFGNVRLGNSVGSTFPCAIFEQTVTCSGIGAVPAGRYARVAIQVAVDPAAPPSVVNEASVSGGGAGEAVARTTTPIDTLTAPFELIPGSAGLSLAATGPEGAPETQAASHPAQLTIDNGLPTALQEAGGNPILISTGHLRDLDVRLPRGMVANPTATPVLCTEVQLTGNGCPDAAAVGTVLAQTAFPGALETQPAPLYNMVAPAGAAAQLGLRSARPRCLRPPDRRRQLGGRIRALRRLP